MIREDFLHQNAFDDVDTYSSTEKQFRLLKLIIIYYEKIKKAFKEGATLAALTKLDVLEDIAKAKFIPEDNKKQFDTIEKKIEDSIVSLT